MVKTEKWYKKTIAKEKNNLLAQRGDKNKKLFKLSLNFDWPFGFSYWIMRR